MTDGRNSLNFPDRQADEGVTVAELGGMSSHSSTSSIQNTALGTEGCQAVLSNNESKSHKKKSHTNFYRKSG